MVGIYKITSPSEKVYIGQSWDLENRLYRYTCSPSRHKYQVLLFNSFMKYGSTNHRMEIVQELPKDVSQEVLDNYEIFFIEQYRESGILLLNLQKGGKGGKHSEESKLKMSVAHTGKKLSKDHVAKIVNANTGKKRSEEYKQKMSEFHKGKIQSEETKEKISSNKKEYFKTHTVHNKGTTLNKEDKLKLSSASTSKKSILQLDLNGNILKEFSSLTEAANSLEIKISHISRVLKGNRKSAGNFKFTYVVGVNPTA